MVVEHDCVVGDHCHLATGAILCGGCEIGIGVHVGASAALEKASACPVYCEGRDCTYTSSGSFAVAPSRPGPESS